MNQKVSQSARPVVSGMRVRVASLAALLLMLVAGPALAEKIGYVDARRLIDESAQGQVQLKQLEQEFAARNREIKGKFDLFKAKETELQKNSVLMSPEDLQKETEVMRELQRELKRDQRDYNEEYNAKRNKSLADLQKVISEAVIFIAERDKFDLIVQQAVYASEQVNLTEVVLKELAKRAK